MYRGAFFRIGEQNQQKKNQRSIWLIIWILGKMKEKSFFYAFMRQLDVIIF